MNRTTHVTTLTLALALIAGCAVDAEPGAQEASSETVAATTAALLTVPARQQTIDSIGIMSWDVEHHIATGTLSVRGMDAQGQPAAYVEIARDEQGVVMSTFAGVLALNAQGEVTEDSLSPEMRGTIALMGADLKSAEVEYGFWSCAFKVGVLIAASADCGGGTHIGCLALPDAFCEASNECANDACGYGYGY